MPSRVTPNSVYDPFSRVRGPGSGRVTPDPPPASVRGPGGGRAIPDTTLGSGDPWETNSRPDLFWSESAPNLAWNLDWSQIPGLPDLENYQSDIADVEQATFDRMKGLLDPVFAQREADMNEMLANRGNPTGSAVSGITRNQFGRDMGEAYERAALDSVMAGRNEHSRLFGLGMGSHIQGIQNQLAQIGLSNQARQQAWQEQMGTRGQLFQELMGQLGTSQFDPNSSLPPTGSGNTNFMDLFQGDMQNSTGWTTFMNALGGMDWDTILNSFGGDGEG